MTLPLRLMILHFSHMGFTDGLTFMINLLVNALMAPRRRKLRILRFRPKGESSVAPLLLLSPRKLRTAFAGPSFKVKVKSKGQGLRRLGRLYFLWVFANLFRETSGP